jgi:GNAT superfamily N-acetyltransferase
MARTPSCPVCGAGGVARTSAALLDEAAWRCERCGSTFVEPALAGLPARVRVRAKREGTAELARQVRRDLVDVRHHFLFRQPVGDGPKPDLPSGVTVGAPTPAELGELGSLIPRYQLAERLDRGDQCLVARLEGRVVGCIWLAPGPLPSDYYPTPVSLAPDEVYTDGLFVDRAFRGQGIGGALLRARIDAARERGYRACLSHVRAGNTPALRSHARYGNPVVEDVYSVVLCRRISFALRRSRARVRVP